MLKLVNHRRRLGLWAGAILSLGLTLAAALTVFAALDAVMLRPLPYPAQEQLKRVLRAQGPERVGPPVSGPAFRDIEAQQTAFAAISAYSDTSLIITGREGAERWLGASVSGHYFDVIGLPPALGRGITAADEAESAARVVVLSHQRWTEHYHADPGVLGQTLTIDGQPHTIVGVTHPQQRLPGRAEVAVPLRLGADGGGRGNNYLLLLGRLKDGVSEAQAQTEFDQIAERLAQAYPDNHAQLHFAIQDLRESMVAPARDGLTVLLAAISLLLLVGSASFVNLLLADHAARQREFATRVALGCSELRLLLAALREAAALVALAALVGLAAGALAMRALPQWLLGARELAIWPTAGLALLAVAGVIAVGAGLLVGVHTLRAVRGNSLTRGTRGASADAARQRTRQLLVVAQIALSLVLMIGAGLMTQSMQQLLRQDPGFDTRNLHALRLTLPPALLQTPPPVAEGVDPGAGPSGQFLLQLEERLQQSAGIEAAGVVSRAPLVDGGGTNSGFRIEGEPAPAEGAEPLVEVRAATPGYFAAIGTPLRAGVGFARTQVDPRARRTLVNEALVRGYIHQREALGAKVLLGDMALEIQGVVADARQDGPDRAVRPEMYLSYLDWPVDSNAVLVVRSELPAADLLTQVRSTVAALRSDVPVYDLQHFDDAAARWTAQRAFLMTLMQYFSLAALAIAMVGLYALFANAIALRQIEFGIRQALGATPSSVIGVVFREGLRVALAGVAVGAVAALAVGRLYESMLYGISARDPSIYLALAGALLVASLLSVALPAWRAARSSPMQALRSE